MASLHNAQAHLRTEDDHRDLAFLEQLFCKPKFQQALDVHNAVLAQSMKVDPGIALTDSSVEQSEEVLALPIPQHSSGQIEELKRLLQRPNIQVNIFYIFYVE